MKFEIKIWNINLPLLRTFSPFFLEKNVFVYEFQILSI